MNTPNHASDTAINRLLDNDVRLLGASQFDNWHIDINDDGAMIGECPRCGSKEIGAVTPEHLNCRSCGHTDGEHYMRVGATSEQPGELRAMPEETDECGLPL